MSSWFVYLIECRGSRVYTGIATDVDRRYRQHATGKGARFTRAWPPERLLARFEYPDRAAASRAEHAIKKLSPARKRALCLQAAPPGTCTAAARHEPPAAAPTRADGRPVAIAPRLR